MLFFETKAHDNYAIPNLHILILTLTYFALNVYFGALLYFKVWKIW